MKSAVLAVPCVVLLFFVGCGDRRGENFYRGGMKSAPLVAIASVLTFVAVCLLVVPFAGWAELGGSERGKFLGAAFLCGALAAGAWYASGLGRKDDWPR